MKRSMHVTLPVLLVFLLYMTLLSSCNKNRGNDTEIPNKVDPAYFAMNPMDIAFDSTEMVMIEESMDEYIESYRAYRKVSLPNHVVPALQFNPLPAGFVLPEESGPIGWTIPTGVKRPSPPSGLAFLSIPELASLLRSGEVTSVELTTFYLNRLQQYDSTLHCVVTLTGEYALERAAMLDRELASGLDRGILHGIPYGIKDLFSFPGYPTTWGAMPYKDQVIDEKSGVTQKLEDAGAVLIAKLTLGALAMGDVWFADTTRNPWNPSQGSSGSSAGPASATAAGLVPFAIGTETYGSIVSPSTRCGTTGLRPTYGRVTRHGAMALSWSMDKVGPICRSAYECAIVFDAIRGEDGKDQTIIPAGFSYQQADLSALRIGYLKSAFEEDYAFKKQDRETLRVLRKLGANPEPVELDVDLPVDAMTNILVAEAAAAFDELTRSNRDTLMVSQGKYAWPALFRAARYMTAVEYIQANRIRTLLIEDFNRIMQEYDVVIVPSFGGDQLPATNLTGHPVVVVPNGFMANGSPTSISFLGNLFDEGTILSVAQAYQDATGFDEMHPPLFSK